MFGPKSQSGAALIIGLVVLLMLTLLGVSAMRSTTLEERMAGNDLDRQQAFEAAESGLRGGEQFLREGVLPQPTPGGTEGFYLPADPAGPPVWEVAVFDAAGSRAYQGDLQGAQARYVVEELGVANLAGQSLASDSPVEISTFYRITARGDGLTTSSEVTLQSVYKR